MDPKLPYGTNYCKCSACNLYFNSDRPFSMHRIGKPGARRCLFPDEMVEKGMSVSSRGYWVSKLLKTVPIYLAGQPRTHDHPKVIAT